jgi:SAM-dependent methyltransferase
VNSESHPENAAHDDDDGVETESPDYADRLATLEGVWWKRLLPVQAPYRWNLRRRQLGRTLDIGCGIGRNLGTLAAGSVGVEHNEVSVAFARRRGFRAYTVDEFLAGEHARAESFDSLLLAHVVEHLTPNDARELVRSYLPYLRPGGRVFFICPQERGYASDPTHRTFVTGEDLVRLARDVGLLAESWHSFPLPRWVGKVLPYNEFNIVAVKPPSDAS